MGRHLLVREIAKGMIGPLFLARTQNDQEVVDTLARVVPMPADLPPKDDQAIADAIWDSANVGHDMVLRVADVVAGNGWVTLVHDHQVGSLLSSMHWRAGDLGGCFPSDIAARIALDVLEGLEQSRGLCETNRIPWRPGSISMGSLYLCGDGRTRALDGQVMAAVMRSERMRDLARTAVSLAPEMLQHAREPDERTDVFAVGVVLWELLTGRELSTDGTSGSTPVGLSVPKDVLVPQGLVDALQRALDLEPDKRQSSLRELAVQLVMGAEKVATYEQVIDFAGQLMPFEMAFRRTESQEPSVQTPEPADGKATPAAPEPTERIPDTAPPVAAEEASPADSAEIQPCAPNRTATAPVETQPAEAGATTPAAKPRDGRLEQVDWPDEDAPPIVAEPSKKANGAKPLSAVKVDQEPERPVARGSSGVIASPVIELKAESRNQSSAAELTSKTTRRDSTRASAAPRGTATAPIQGAVRASSRPTNAKAVQAASPSRELKQKAPEVRKSGGFQVSATTLILGFSTTVLAVVLIMILLQQRSTPPIPSVVAPPASAAALQQPPLPTSSPSTLSAEQGSATQIPPASAPLLSAKGANDAQPIPAEARATPKRSSKSSSAKTSGKDDGPIDGPKTNKKSGQFIPDEI